MSSFYASLKDAATQVLSSYQTMCWEIFVIHCGACDWFTFYGKTKVRSWNWFVEVVDLFFLVGLTHEEAARLIANTYADRSVPEMKLLVSASTFRPNANYQPEN